MTHTLIYPGTARHDDAGHLERGGCDVVDLARACGHAMADDYDGRPRPAVVFVRDGRAREIVARETWEDVLRLQRPLHQ